jgi:plastocyanin
VHPTEMKGTITVVASNSSQTAATAAAGPGAAAGLSEVTTDNKFSQASLTVDKGISAALTVQNKGQALHNWHVLNVKGSDGNDIKTDLVPAASTATVTFQIDRPGTYDFQCDVHPTEMKGKLTVK